MTGEYMKRIPSNGQGLVIYREPNLAVFGVAWPGSLAGSCWRGQTVISIDTAIVEQNPRHCV